MKPNNCFKFIIYLFLLVLVSCTLPTSSSTEKKRLRIHLSSEPAILNPILATDAYASHINKFLFDSLIERDLDTLEFIPKIAERWTISDDKKVYTFYMRRDVKWHDGQPLTADDVVFSYDLIMNPQVQAPHLKVYYQDIESVKKLDDYTVQFKYKTIYYKALTFCGMMDILPKHLLHNKIDSFAQIPFSRAPLGNGPYVFKEWKTNKRIVLTRNENYWDKKPDIRQIEFSIIPDSAIALQVLKKGDLDLLDLRPIQWDRQTNTEKFLSQFQKLKYPNPGFSYIGWNHQSVFFKDTRVRTAMTHMIDRQKINQKLNYNLGEIVTGPFVPFAPQYNQNIKPLAYDVKRAQQLLNDAGWKDTNNNGLLDKDGREFEFDFIYPASSKAVERISTILKEDLEKIGIKMNISKMEWGAFLNRIVEKRQFDATSLSWSSSIDSDPYQVWHSSHAHQERSSNFIAFANVEADRIMEMARTEFDDKKRNELYWQFHQIIHDLQPYTFLYNFPALVVVSRRFENVKVHKLGLDITEWTVRE